MSRRFSSEGRRAPAPIDAAKLEALALAYVGRYATTRAKLGQYLDRKLAQRGWDGEAAADVASIVDRCARLGYVDDVAFAAARGASLARRGYGARRVAQALRAAGIDADDAAPVERAARDDALRAAIAYAKRRRIGPFSNNSNDDARTRQRGFAALLRAGHDPEIARHVAYASEVDILEAE
ncbi:RecX family transcriptional regulator [Sphingomonas sp. MMS24-J13]|uniref:RecX family transcriptional regulator n=1 Tax=Sphingomonas sp. MMS24-J13 TaxID=3238686 RepID=UPI00384C2F45